GARRPAAPRAVLARAPRHAGGIRAGAAERGGAVEVLGARGAARGRGPRLRGAPPAGAVRRSPGLHRAAAADGDAAADHRLPRAVRRLCERQDRPRGPQDRARRGPHDPHRPVAGLGVGAALRGRGRRGAGRPAGDRHASLRRGDLPSRDGLAGLPDRGSPDPHDPGSPRVRQRGPGPEARHVRQRGAGARPGERRGGARLGRDRLGHPAGRVRRGGPRPLPAARGPRRPARRLRGAATTGGTTGEAPMPAGHEGHRP
ncbi:MAG: hypothetical protein H6Q10_3053, partial [Acidobacteria bacterium]|nr:hypothetical protein [Acidobacteriota bacterium]